MEPEVCHHAVEARRCMHVGGRDLGGEVRLALCLDIQGSYLTESSVSYDPGAGSAPDYHRHVSVVDVSQ